MRKFVNMRTTDLTGVRNTAAGLLFPLNKRAVFKSVLLILQNGGKQYERC